MVLIYYYFFFFLQKFINVLVWNGLREFDITAADGRATKDNEIGSRSPCMRPRSDPPKKKNSNVVRSRLIILINEEINEAN